MAISVQCGDCGKRFTVDKRSAGRRMPCKFCWAALTIPQPGDANYREVPDKQTYDVVPKDGEATDVRESKPLAFAGGKMLDTAAPAALALLSLGWVVITAVRTNDSDAWIGASRAAVALAVYSVIIFPFAYFGVKSSTTRLRVAMPPAAGWRSFAAFSFPFALAYVLWLSGGLGAMLAGLLFGLALTIPILLLFFRLTFDEAIHAFLPGMGYFLIGALLCAAFVFGSNLLVYQILRASEKQVAASPVVGRLTWERLQSPTPRTAQGSGAGSVGTQSSAVSPAPAVPSTTPPSVAPSVLAPAPAAPTQPAVDPEVARLLADPNFMPNVPQAIREMAARTRVEKMRSRPSDRDATASARPMSPPGGTATERSPGEGSSPVAPPAPPSDSPLFAERQVVPLKENVKEILYPVTVSNHLLLVREAEAAQNNLERWTIMPPRPEGNPVQIAEERGAEPSRALSPDGAHIARIVERPQPAVQIHSLEDGKAVNTIELVPNLGAPTLLGFVNDSEFLLLRSAFGSSRVQLWSIIGQQVEPISEAQFRNDRMSRANFAISPNGRWLAAAVRHKDRQQGERPAVEIYDTGRLSLWRRFPIAGWEVRGAVQPSGIAFSRDSAELAALFERTGEGLLVAWDITLATNSAPNRSYSFTARQLAAPWVSRDDPDALAWVADDAAWLVRGRALIDVPSGKVLANLSLPVRMQRSLPWGGVHLVVDRQNQPPQLIAVQFDKRKIDQAAGRTPDPGLLLDPNG